MTFLNKIEGKLLVIISFILAFNSYFFIERKSTDAFPHIFNNINIHYLIYVICLVTILALFYEFFKEKKIIFSQILQYALFTFLPMEIALILGLFVLHSETKVRFAFYFITGVYLIVASVFFIEKKVSFQKTKENFKETIHLWLKKQGLTFLFILALSLSVFGYYGISNIENHAAVDEPLWTFNRIPNFWKNIQERDWKNTDVSDKPGLTVAVISGIGLLHNDPTDYASLKKFNPQKDIRVMNKAFRLPLTVFCLLSLLLFYIFIQKLLNKEVALLATVFISTSPMLIGMSRIINPDAILWVFSSLTILAYLIFLKNKTRFWLYSSGILLGLAILTKYVANILYIFFFALIFFEYLFISKNKNISITKHLKDSLLNFFSLVLVSLITFYILFPETWLSLKSLFTGTLLSQAFISVAPLFIGIILFIVVDTFFVKNKILTPIFDFFIKNRSYLMISLTGIFLLFVLFVFANTYLSMKFIDFEAILSSPKSSYRTNSMLSIYSANFYPLIFASLPVVILGLFFSIIYSLKMFKKDNMELKIIAYFIFFILLYYLGTTFDKVVSVIRYQVVLYPLLLIISAIGINQFIKLFPHKKTITLLFAIFFLLLGINTLSKTNHLYLGYASKLLPNKYFVDTKGMGDGSYEIAQQLNSLTNAKDLFIWTDKMGVCNFFVGKCDSFYDLDSFLENKIDYFVVSSDRKSKFVGATSRKSKIPYDFEKIYDSNESLFSIFIDNRPANYVKALPAEKFIK
ncbi:MAG: glycosyltransferase family 39 protein [Parcubacteria group bacterium]